MQQLVGFVAVGLTQIPVTNLLDFGILVALANGFGGVLVVEGLGAFGADIRPVANAGGNKLGCPPPLTQPPGQPMTSIKV